MCAWCYGFTPVIRRLKALWVGRLSVQVLVGSLNPYAQSPLASAEKDKIAVSWHRAQGKSHLPFDYSFFLRQDAIYDTEPACRALLTVRHLRPGLSLEDLRALHSAFYAGGRDITNTHVLVEVVRPFGIPENLFLAVFETNEIYRQTQEEFQLVERMGVSTLPSVYLDHPQGPRLISRGFLLPVTQQLGPLAPSSANHINSTAFLAQNRRVVWRNT
nr:DsbA family protein [Rufibacter sp. XAAS-G3-1]